MIEKLNVGRVRISDLTEVHRPFTEERQRELIDALATYPDRESEARESCRRLGLDESEWRNEAEELRVLRVRLGVLEGRG